MKIQLDKDYFITDGYGDTVILAKDMHRTTVKVDKKTGNKTEEQVITNVGYYGTVHDAVIKYIKTVTHEHFKDSDITLKEFVERYESVAKEVMKVIKG